MDLLSQRLYLDTYYFLCHYTRFENLNSIQWYYPSEMTIGASPKEKNYKNMNFTETKDFFATRWELANIWAFSGQLQYSELFYGYYTNDTYSSYAKYMEDKKVESGNKGYRIPLAYLTCTVGSLVYSFFFMLREMTKNSRLAGSTGGDDDFEFSWKIFTAWDFMIANPETADNKVASIATVVRESIVDEQENTDTMTVKEKRILLAMRIIANILVMVVIAGAVAIITWRTIATTGTTNANATKPTASPSWVQQNELSLDITAITMICKTCNFALHHF